MQNADIGRAVVEILNSGTTDAIPKEVASSRTALSARGLALQSGNSKVSIGSLSLVDKQELIGGYSV